MSTRPNVQTIGKNFSSVELFQANAKQHLNSFCVTIAPGGANIKPRAAADSGRRSVGLRIRSSPVRARAEPIAATFPGARPFRRRRQAATLGPQMRTARVRN